MQLTNTLLLKLVSEKSIVIIITIIYFIEYFIS
jgi:hypothetical protein